MTFLQLVVRLQSLTGTSAGGPAISTVVGQTGEFLRLVNWIGSAWNEIQTERRDWSYKWQEAATPAGTIPPNGITLLASANTDTYDVATAMAPTGTIIRLSEGPWVIEGTFGKRRLEYMHPQLFEEWRAAAWLTLDGSPPPPDVISGIPFRMTVLPDGKKMRFDRIPSVDLTLKGDFYVQNQTLALDADIPILPVQYHDAIVYRAIKKWAEFEEAPEQFQTAKMEDDKWTGLMVTDLLPRMGVGAKALR